MQTLQIPSAKTYRQLLERVRILEKEVAWLKRYVATPANNEDEEHTEHIWSEWEEGDYINPHNLQREVHERRCEYPKCDVVEECGTGNHPHKFTINAGVHYFPPDICERCRYRYT